MDCFTAVSDWLEQLTSKAVSPAEIQQIYQERTQKVEPRLQAFIRYFTEPLQQETIEPQPWTGLPIGIKDNLCVAGHPTTCGSQILANFIPPYHATVVQRLLEHGLAIMGKTNMDEFAMGSSCENSSFYPTLNPWDLTRVPGGSSGGSASAVAAGEVPWALGSDTGGSVRLPAAFCGIVGLKPTYGLLSRYGLVAYASSLDQVGLFTRTVKDNALLLQLVAGHDPLDSTSLRHMAEDYVAAVGQGVQGLRIGLPREWWGDGIEPEVKQAVEKAVTQLQTAGAIVEETSLPHSAYALAAYYLIATSEASSNLARYDGLRYGLRAPAAKTLEEVYVQSRSQGFGSEVKRRIMLGTYALSSGYYEAFYKKAQQVRALILADFQQNFDRFDILLSPTAPTVAFKLGEKMQDPLSMYLADALTVTVNLAGVPAISVPCGFSPAGLPIGMQLIAKPLGEALLYRVAEAYESQNNWMERVPVV